MSSSSFVEFAIEHASLREHFKFDCKWSIGGQYLAVGTFVKDQGGSVILITESGTLLEAEQLVQRPLGKSIECSLWTFQLIFSKLSRPTPKSIISNGIRNFRCLRVFGRIKRWAALPSNRINSDGCLVKRRQSRAKK
jgi:hypothetical protein